MGRYFPFLGNIILDEEAIRPMHIVMAVFVVAVVFILSRGLA